jgi:hypothetical protein
MNFGLFPWAIPDQPPSLFDSLAALCVQSVDWRDLRAQLDALQATGQLDLLNKPDAEGYTLPDMAKRHRHTQAITLLKQYGAHS